MNEMRTLGLAILQWHRIRGGLTIRRMAIALTQDDVARLIGVSTKTVGRWERGVVEPKGTELSLWMAALGLTLNASGAGWSLDVMEDRV